MLRDSRRPLATACAMVLLLHASVVSAGSYLQSEGDLNYSTGLGFITSNKEWDSRAHLQDLGCTSEYAFLSQYLEYGYSYYYTLYGGVNLARSRCGNESTTGFGDIRAGVRGRLDQTRNHRAWELELSIPTSSDETGRTRLGCGVYGLAAGVATKEDVSESLTLGGEARLQFWEAPLSHQYEGKLSAAGPLGSVAKSLNWNVGLSGHAPLESSDQGPGQSISDCGTQGQSVRGSIALGYRVGSGQYFECGHSLGLWGVDTTKRIGFYCGYSHRWKR